MLRFATRCSPHILSLIVCIGDNYLRRGNNMLRPSGGGRTAQSGQICVNSVEPLTHIALPVRILTQYRPQSIVRIYWHTEHEFAICTCPKLKVALRRECFP